MNLRRPAQVLSRFARSGAVRPEVDQEREPSHDPPSIRPGIVINLPPSSKTSQRTFFE
jgi:hypothetical protein